MFRFLIAIALGSVALSPSALSGDRCAGAPGKSCATLAAEHQKERSTCKSRPGASIGMTKAEAIRSRWGGHVLAINETRTAHGIREQWVYEWPLCIDGFTGLRNGWRGYLYFDNGVLTAIQR